MAEMKYPIGIQSFEKIRRGGHVYVDKTDLIYRLVQDDAPYFLSRPRRFGKSLLISTLQAYFQGQRELFAGLALERLETEWTQYPVLRVDFANKNFNRPSELTDGIETFIAQAESTYGKDPAATSFGDRFMSVITKAEERTGRKVVVLIDEYDKPLLDVLGTPQEQVNRDILRGFYGTLKSADQHLRFVLLTGITKFAQVSIFSGLNNLRDISLSPRYDTLCGITTEELHTVFTEPIRTMAAKLGKTEDQMKDALRLRYDGYHFSEAMHDVYNPFSILNVMAEQKLADYWFSTATPTYLIRLMERFNQDISQLVSQYYPARLFMDQGTDEEHPLPMLYQSGYLTIKDYDAEYEEYRLDFPNKEVSRGFLTLTTTSYLKLPEDVSPRASRLARALKCGQTDRFRAELTALLSSIPYHLRRRKDEEEQERDFHYTFYLIMRLVGDFTVFSEKRQSQGRVDCVIETSEHVYIFEFKRDGSATDALRQIHDRGYAREYQADPRRLHLIGCNFSSKTGTIEGWEEE